MTLVGGQAPTQEIEQVYYLGIFDPQEQLPPAVYRITVRGQGSLISQTRFASGWIPSAIADTLTSQLSFGPDGPRNTGSSMSGVQGIANGRRLLLFGPEGFREAPKDHRLAIVMGSDPSEFFDAISAGLSAVAEVKSEGADAKAMGEVLGELSRLRSESTRLRDLRQDLDDRLGRRANP